MRECQKEFAKRGSQEQIPGKSITDKPVIRYVHNCKVAKIGLIVTPETEATKAALSQVICKTCYKHCRKCKHQRKKVKKMKVILTGEEYKALETKANRAASDRKELVDLQKYIKDQLEGVLIENTECEMHCSDDGACDECELQPFIVSNEKEAVEILQNIAAKAL